MATENGQNNAPDSWDQDVDGQDDNDPGNDLAKPLSSLNVHAPSFVPGQNVFAAEFVPTFTNPSTGKILSLIEKSIFVYTMYTRVNNTFLTNYPFHSD